MGDDTRNTEICQELRDEPGQSVLKSMVGPHPPTPPGPEGTAAQRAPGGYPADCGEERGHGRAVADRGIGFATGGAVADARCRWRRNCAWRHRDRACGAAAYFHNDR